MFADPSSITVNAVVTSLARITNKDGTAKYGDAAGIYSLETKQNASATRFRREARINIAGTAVDPITLRNVPVTASVILTIDEPKFGFTDLQLLQVKNALTLWATDANVTKLLVGEF